MKTGYDDFFRKAKVNAGAGDSLSTKSMRKFKLNTAAERGESLSQGHGRAQREAQNRDTQNRAAPKRSTSSQQAERLRQNVTAANRKNKKRRAFPLRIVVISVFGLVLTGVGLFHHEDLDKLLSSIELSAMGQARAESAPQAVTAPSGSREPTAVNATAADKVKQPSEWTEVEINHLQKLVQRKEQLDVRESELARMEAELQGQKDELEKKLKSLDETRVGISTMLQERTTQDEAKVETLVQVYSNMKAQQAAKVLETLDEDLAVEIIGRMKKKNAAEVLNLMKPEKAQSFSEKFAGYKKR